MDASESDRAAIMAAATVCGLAPPQTRLAQLIVEGRDLAAAAGLLGVSFNTLRTHLQRMIARTGARRQAKLVRALRSAEARTT